VRREVEKGSQMFCKGPSDVKGRVFDSKHIAGDQVIHALCCKMCEEVLPHFDLEKHSVKPCGVHVKMIYCIFVFSFFRSVSKWLYVEGKGSTKNRLHLNNPFLEDKFFVRQRVLPRI
jgi:hypothetical protein